MKSAGMTHVFGAAFLLAAGLFAGAARPQAAYAQTAAPAAETSTPDAKPKAAEPQAATPAAPAPATTAPATPASPSPAAPESETKGVPGMPGIPDDATTQMLDIPSRPVALLAGKSDWDAGFKSILTSIATIQAEVAKAGLKQAGKPIAVFTETNDNGFSYQAMIPLTGKPEGKTELSNDVKIGESPSGKAIKFQHRGAYDDIDSTYDLITAYLDEKGLEAQNFFIEEYLTDTKNADDQALEVDIYVFIK
jgi:effector-binding domain-containing protein